RVDRVELGRARYRGAGVHGYGAGDERDARADRLLVLIEHDRARGDEPLRRVQDHGERGRGRLVREPHVRSHSPIWTNPKATSKARSSGLGVGFAARLKIATGRFRSPRTR